MGKQAEQVNTGFKATSLGGVKQTERGDSGFRRSVNASSLFWDVTQRKLVCTDVSGQPTVPSWMVKQLLGTDRLSRSVCIYQFTLRNIPEKQKSHKLKKLAISPAAAFRCRREDKTSRSEVCHVV